MTILASLSVNRSFLSINANNGPDYKHDNNNNNNHGIIIMERERERESLGHYRPFFLRQDKIYNNNYTR